MSRNSVIDKHYRENYERFVKLIRYRNCDVPEDVVQEAYARAIRYYRTFNPEKSGFHEWFFSILNNTFRDVKKQEQDRGIVRSIHENDEDVVEELPKKLVYDMVVSMNEGEERNVLIYYYILGFRTRDISDYLDIGHSNVRVIIHRWKRRMEEEYASLNSDD